MGRGDCSSAFRCLEGALETFGSYLQTTECELSPALSLSGIDLPWSSMVTVPGLEDEAFYIHNHAFCVELADSSTCTNEDMLMASLVVVFNLALCNHQVGRQTNDIEKLQRACHFYKICTETLSFKDHVNMNTVASVLALLCQNNEAQIRYRSFGEQQKSLEILASPFVRDRIMISAAAAMDDQELPFLLSGIFQNLTVVHALVGISSC